MTEQWKIIEEFPNYEISSYGRIRNISTQKYLSGGKDKDGYFQVTLIKNKKQFCRRVNKLVAIEFIKNPSDYPIINHKDENKENNHIDNLEWCTYQYNNIYGTRLDSYRKKVKCIETNIIYDGLRVASRCCNIPHQSIIKSCKRGYSAGGYHWNYVKEE